MSGAWRTWEKLRLAKINKRFGNGRKCAKTPRAIQTILKKNLPRKTAEKAAGLRGPACSRQAPRCATGARPRSSDFAFNWVTDASHGRLGSGRRLLRLVCRGRIRFRR